MSDGSKTMNLKFGLLSPFVGAGCKIVENETIYLALDPFVSPSDAHAPEALITTVDVLYWQSFMSERLTTVVSTWWSMVSQIPDAHTSGGNLLRFCHARRTGACCITSTTTYEL
jgi:hypothetical protein